MDSIKKRLYFVVARYFRFWARRQLNRWHPQVFVITGSSGKTTTLHLAETQLGDGARYSHKANSSFGVPFDILGLGRKSLGRSEWISLVFKAPFRAFKKLHHQKIYMVEVDCDRPNEGKFLAELLRPNGVIWLSSTQTHAMNFDKLVNAGEFKTVEEAIAYEYGYLIQMAKDFVIVNADEPNITNQLKRTQANQTLLKNSQIKAYLPKLDETDFELGGQTVSLPVLVPREVGMSVLAIKVLCEKINQPFDSKFIGFSLPPGRSSVFAGLKDITIVDSTYNASLDAAEAIINMFASLDAPKKWVVISDILEQGESEQRVHQQLAHNIAKHKFDKIIVMGPRCKKYCSPELTKLNVEHTSLETPREVLDLLNQELRGGDTVLFKGTRFLEGVIEHLLKNKSDVARLCRREAVWEKRRKAWGL